jgi:hypothetical protein
MPRGIAAATGGQPCRKLQARVAMAMAFFGSFFAKMHIADSVPSLFSFVVWTS